MGRKPGNCPRARCRWLQSRGNRGVGIGPLRIFGGDPIVDQQADILCGKGDWKIRWDGPRAGQELHKVIHGSSVAEKKTVDWLRSSGAASMGAGSRQKNFALRSDCPWRSK
jgi:hypothetical protein